MTIQIFFSGAPNAKEGFTSTNQPACKLCSGPGILMPKIAVRRPELHSLSVGCPDLIPLNLSLTLNNFPPCKGIYLKNWWFPALVSTPEMGDFSAGICISKARNVQNPLPLYRGMSARCQHHQEASLCNFRSAMTTQTNTP